LVALASASFFVSSFSAAIVPFLPVAFPRTARVITRYSRYHDTHYYRDGVAN
jgi:hypothetical protein